MITPQSRPYIFYISWFTLIVSVLFTMWLQFYRLGELPIVQWDESRLAVNAAEMYRSGKLLVSTYELKPDLYNTKPPLMIWLQSGSMRIFGVNEFAVRFPSAMAGFLSIMLCGFIIYRQYRNLLLASVAILILACSNGFIQLHGSMTGDYDSLLAFWLLAAFRMFYHGYIAGDDKDAQKWFSALLSLAVMTKSAAALVCFPVFIMATLPLADYRKTLHATVYCLMSLIPFMIYCLAREQSAPGYLEAIQKNDFSGRFSRALEGHTSEWHYYIVNLFDYRYHLMIWLLPPALLLAIFLKDRFYRYYAFCLVGFLLFLSVAKTRIHWYDTPALPMVAIVITSFLFFLYRQAHELHWKIAFIVLLCITITVPIMEKYRFIAHRKDLKLDMSHYELSDMLRMYDGQDSLKYIAYHYDAEFYFYTKANPKVFRGRFTQLQPGDMVAYGNRFRDSMPMMYNYNLLDSTPNAWKVRITGIK